MTLRPTEAGSHAAKPRAVSRHYGFREDGSWFVSEVPVQNAPTEYVRKLVRGVRESFWSPADVALDISTKDHRISGMFSPDTVARWSGMNRFRLWELSRPASTVEQCVAWCGRTTPLWVEDEAAWMTLVRRAEAHRGERSSGEYLWHNGEEIPYASGRGPREVAGELIRGTAGGVRITDLIGRTNDDLPPGFR